MGAPVSARLELVRCETEAELQALVETWKAESTPGRAPLRVVVDDRLLAAPVPLLFFVRDEAPPWVRFVSCPWAKS